MSNYSDNILEMLKQDEGYVGLNDQTRRSAHKSTSTDHGAYYDARGFLTTGYGSLVSKNKKGSIEEANDIASWKERTQLDPFSLDEEQATQILPQDIDRVTAKAKVQLGDVDFDTLPEQAQQAIVSLSYNTGTLGPNTAAAIRKAAQSSSTRDWQAVAAKIKNWHGSKAKEQPLGVLARRERESDLVGSIQGLTLEGSDSETLVDTSIPDGEFFVEPSTDQINTNASNDLSRAPATVALTRKDQLLPAGANLSKGNLPADTPLEEQPIPATGQVKEVDPQGNFTLRQQSITATGPAGATTPSQLQDAGVMKNAFGQSAFDAEKESFQIAKQQAAEEAERPFMVSALAAAGDFTDHLTNTYLTENIIGSNLRKWMLVGNTR